MATFRVGQKVRIISAGPGATAARCVGQEATIVAIPSTEFGMDCDIVIHGRDYSPFDHPWTFAPFARLAPLTDPRADQFVQDMERLAHLAQELNEPEKVTP